MVVTRLDRRRILVAGAFLSVAGVLAGCSNAASTDAASSSSASAKPTGTVNIAYLSFAVANSYDAPMLAAAQTVAADNDAKLTVFDANNDPKVQFSQLQNVISSGTYQAVIVQPIFGTGLTDLVSQAIAKGIKVVNIDQILGPDLSTAEPQVKGMSANVTFVPTDIGTKLGKLTIEACASKNLSPCKVGYLYDIKASSLDVAIQKSFAAATAGSPVQVVAEGEDFFNPAGGLKAVQNMLTAHPDLDLVVGSDQGIQGAEQALAGANKTGKVLLVGYGGSAAGLNATAAGTWYGTVVQAPATEGRLGAQAAVKAVRDNTVTGGVNPLESLPDGGVATKANATSFTGEWPG